MTRFLWILSNISSRLWFSAALYGIAAIATALAAIFLKDYIPFDLPQKIGSDAVDSILNILAASMLSVTIFSLSTMVSAYSAATNNGSPRATKLLIEDKISHRALATFLGTFIFSIVGIIALKTGVYGEEGRLVLFVVTIGVILMIVVTLLRWIEYLARLGRVNETIDRVETVTTDSFKKRLKTPYLGGAAMLDVAHIPKNTTPVSADVIGYVQHIDMPHLSDIAKEHALTIYVTALPGKFLDTTLPVAHVAGKCNTDIIKAIRKGFITGNERSFQQDPRFGIAVLHEIASRALSPAVNDPGTAIHVIGSVVRILSLWAKRHDMADKDEPSYPKIHVLPLQMADIFDDFFPAVSRDGAPNLEVHIRLQKAYEALARTQDNDLKQSVEKHAALSLKRALQALALKDDADILQALATTIRETCVTPATGNTETRS